MLLFSIVKINSFHGYLVNLRPLHSLGLTRHPLHIDWKNAFFQFLENNPKIRTKSLFVTEVYHHCYLWLSFRPPALELGDQRLIRVISLCAGVAAARSGPPANESICIYEGTCDLNGEGKFGTGVTLEASIYCSIDRRQFHFICFTLMTLLKTIITEKFQWFPALQHFLSLDGTRIRAGITRMHAAHGIDRSCEHALQRDWMILHLSELFRPLLSAPVGVCEKRVHVGYISSAGDSSDLSV